VARAREGGGPTLIEVKFTRYFGHFEGDQQLYRADEVRNARENLDCLKVFRARVTGSGQLTDDQLDQVDQEVATAIDAVGGRRQGRAEAGRRGPAHRRLRLVLRGDRDMARSITYREAINEAIAQEMARDERVIVMGEDNAGGAGSPGEDGRLGRGARCHQGPVRKVPGRVLDTPISGVGFIGAAVGAATGGLRPVVELMFIDFMGVCFDQIFNQAAKFRYMFGGKAVTPVTIRTMWGAGSGRPRSTARACCRCSPTSRG
jgi:hypothetical protein